MIANMVLLMFFVLGRWKSWGGFGNEANVEDLRVSTMHHPIHQMHELQAALLYRMRGRITSSYRGVGSMSEINPNNTSDDYRTPKEIFNGFNDRFDFTLDVAASDENALCRNYFTKDDDGLSRKWEGSVWCNPPYQNPSAWIEKGISELQLENCDSVVYLLNVDTSTKWFHDLIMPNCEEIHLIKGRLNFGGPHVVKRGSNPKPSMVVVFTSDPCGWLSVNCITSDGLYSNWNQRITTFN